MKRHYELTLTSPNGGLGVGLVVLSDGKIRLRKWSGPMKLNGEYRVSVDRQRTLFDVDIDIPSGATLATGIPIPKGLSFKLQFETASPEDDVATDVETPVGSVQVHLKRCV